jgi:tRNA-dihydrouridine synthase 2
MEESIDRLWRGEKYCLGPMVRASTLPLRLAALYFGADAVYSEEIPSWRAAACTRRENDILQCCDFFTTQSGRIKEVILRTHYVIEKDAKRLVVQLGAGDAVSALKGAQIFENDVAAIDINMGCPKHYSVSRGMGSELMVRPEIAEDIIKTLRRNLSIPVSVKTRIFMHDDKTVDMRRSQEWVEQLQHAGANAIAGKKKTQVIAMLPRTMSQYLQSTF